MLIIGDNMIEKIYKSKDWLEKNYCELRRETKDMAAECLVGMPVIQHHLRKFRLKRTRNRPDFAYKLDEKYFENIDTEEKAYWLGFIAADGCVQNGCGRKKLSIELSRKDESHLYKLKNALKYEGPIYKKSRIQFNKMMFSSHLAIASMELVRHLISHGITERKSNILKAPNIDRKLIRHWIRGLFDGDGSVSLCKDGNIRGQFFGTKDVIQFVGKNIPGTDTVTKKSDSEGYYHSFGGNKLSKRIYNYLYKNATIFLDRKKIVFKQINGGVSSQNITL